VNAGGVTSIVQVTVLDIVEVLLQRSVAVKVRVCERPQEFVTTGPSA
jgi:hypothetical protein